MEKREAINKLIKEGKKELWVVSIDYIVEDYLWFVYDDLKDLTERVEGMMKGISTFEKFKEYETPDLSKDYSEWRFSYVEDGQECNFKIRFEAIRA